MAPANTPSPVRRYNLRSYTPQHLQIFNPPLEPCGDFHLFARFPADVRWLVWQQSLSHERWISIKFNRLDYTCPAQEERKLANSEEYNIVLGHRWRISKLFRTTSESRMAALAFYRVKLPCWYKSKDKNLFRGTLYVCPELDHLRLDSLEYFQRFAHDLWACDPRHVGLINLALRVGYSKDDVMAPIVRNSDIPSLQQGLSRIERLTMMNRRGSKKLWGGLSPGVGDTSRMNYLVPIRGGSQNFNRLPYDPRLYGKDLKRMYLGYRLPRYSFNRWFKLLSTLGVKHEHKVIYQFGSCRGGISGCVGKNFPTISDRESAVDWVRRDNEELGERFERFNRLPELRGQMDFEVTSILEESPQPVVGFWLFSMDSVLTPDDPNIYDTEYPWGNTETVDMSQHMPELCLANIF
ncbi:hypothetical protein FNAPI_3053 [Fusarium napiforme]|uniref:2EXR domain-containing protein n=1 Tax=Fusarium napiforme TaxID=42672 RepID=A0A8H5NEY2_9HYPO|nr:hypothetical protein FNAPI_3053 [Fusarium napiforme]